MRWEHPTGRISGRLCLKREIGEDCGACPVALPPANLRAKTGTISRVSALSGLVRSLSGERIVFSIISNDGRSPETVAKRLEDRIGIELALFDRAFAGPAVEFVDESLTRSTVTNRHTVLRGESLSTIASRYGLELDALLGANPQLSPNRIVPGSGAPNPDDRLKPGPTDPTSSAPRRPPRSRTHGDA